MRYINIKNRKELIMTKAEKVIVYIINYFQCNYSPNDLGSVKLNKILWFADRAFMYENYKSITQEEYIRNPNGPVLKSMEKILNKLENEGFIKRFNTNKGSYIQKSFLCLKEPDLKGIKAQEISKIDGIITKFAQKSAKELSEETHDEVWENTKDGHVMPLESVFFKDIVSPTQEDIQWALEKLKKKGVNAD